MVFKATTMQYDQIFEMLLGLCASFIVLASLWIVYILIQIEQNKAAFYSLDIDDKDHPEGGGGGGDTIKSSLDLEIEMTEQDGNSNSPTKPQPSSGQQQQQSQQAAEPQIVRKNRKRRIRPSFTIMQFASVGALILLTYLLLVQTNAPMWLSAIGSLVVFGVFLRFQIGDEIRRQRWDRLSLLLSLFLFIASLLSMGVFAMKSLKKGEIYEGPARIVKYDATSYNNSLHDPSIRSDLHVQWGKDWGCPLSGSKVCVASVQGAMCNVNTETDDDGSSGGGNNRRNQKRNLLKKKKQKKRSLMDEGDNVEDTADEEGANDEADGDGDGDLEEENAELEQENSDLEQQNEELEQKIEELEAANEEEQEALEDEKEVASEEVAEVEAEEDEAIAEEEEYEYEDAKIYDEEIISMEEEVLEDEAENTSNSADAEAYEEEEDEYEEYETEISQEFDEVVDELESEEESYEESAEDHEEDADIAAESEESHEEVAGELESEASLDSTAEEEEAEVYEEYGEDEVEEEEIMEEDMEYEEEEAEEEEGIYYEADDWYWDEATLEYDDDFYDNDYWDYDWDSAWGDYACEDLFNDDRDGKTYDLSKPAGGDDDWPYINIYGSCKTCDAYILDYFAEEAFERYEDYKKQSILFMTAAIGGFIVSLVGFIKYSLAPPAENEIQLLGSDGGVMA